MQDTYKLGDYTFQGKKDVIDCFSPPIEVNLIYRQKFVLAIKINIELTYDIQSYNP